MLYFELRKVNISSLDLVKGGKFTGWCNPKPSLDSAQKRADGIGYNA